MATKKRRLNGDGSFRKRKDGTWEYRVSVSGFYTDEGKPVRISTYGKTQDECRKKATSKINELTTGTAKSKDDVTIRDLALLICEEKLNDGTIQEQTYARHIETIKRISPISSMKVSQITAVQLKAFLIGQRHYSDSSIRKDYQMLKQVFEEAQRRKIITENPMTDIKCPKSAQTRDAVRALTIAEEKRLIDVLNTKEIKYSDVMIISLFTGLRCGEVLALTANDIDMEHKMLHVSRTVSNSITGAPFINSRAKTFAGTRDLRINDDLCAFFSRIISESKGAEFLFTDDYGHILSTNTINTHFAKAIKRYGIEQKIHGKKITLHSLRHTYATRCIESGMQAKVLQHRLGHKNIQVTYNVYGDVFTLFEDASLDTADAYMRSIGVRLGYTEATNARQ